MTKAAVKLHLTPSALSMLVRGMEDDLGIRLFDRTTRRLVLTSAGSELLPIVQEVFTNLEGKISFIQQAQEARASHLSIATSPLLASGLVPKVIASFRQQHPSVRVTLFDSPLVDSIPKLLRDRTVDMAIWTASSDTLDLHSTLLYVDPLNFVCHLEHPLANRREVEWRELIDERLILIRHGSGLRTLTDRALLRWGKKINPCYEVSNVATAMGLVEAGEGVSILPSYAISKAQSFHQDVRLVSIPLVSPVIKREIVALVRAESDVTSTSENFLSHFRRLAGLAHPITHNFSEFK